jgi:manganese/zinc/iron transport system permease protein
MMDLSVIESYNSQIVLMSTMLLGVASGIVGLFTLLRRRSLIGDCVAHASLPGICVAFLLFQQKDFFILSLGAITAGLLSTWLVSTLCAHTRIKEDSAIALVLSTFFAGGLALSKIIQTSSVGNKAGLESYIFGNASTIIEQDLYVIAFVSVVCISVITLLFKEFVILCFDQNFGASQGFSPLILDFILMSVLCFCTASGLPAVGAVLIVALLIIPAATARLWTDNIYLMALLSALIGMSSALVGTLISALVPSTQNFSGFPTGPLIVLSAATLFIISLLFGTAHGLVWKFCGRQQA